MCFFAWLKMHEFTSSSTSLMPWISVRGLAVVETMPSDLLRVPLLILSGAVLRLSVPLLGRLSWRVVLVACAGVLLDCFRLGMRRGSTRNVSQTVALEVVK